MKERCYYGFNIIYSTILELKVEYQIKKSVRGYIICSSILVTDVFKILAHNFSPIEYKVNAKNLCAILTLFSFHISSLITEFHQYT